MTMKRILRNFIPLLAAAMALTGCSNSNWHLKGTVEGASDAALLLEIPNGAGGWYAIDTITTDSHGSFKYKGTPAGYPEIYRLTLDGKSLYFPVDSLETVEITADAAGFDRKYTLGGSETAELFSRVNSLIDSVSAIHGAAAGADENLKRELGEIILGNRDGIVAYYTVLRRVGDTPVYDPADRSDLRIIGAVANAFATARPSDPHTPLLTQLYLASRRNLGLNRTAQTFEAEQIGLPEIALLDEKGAKCSLTAEAAKGKVLVINFTAYSAQESPAYNVELAKIYEKYRSRGLEIFQIGFDEDEVFWKDGARNLPWITVYNSPAAGAQTLMTYNVGALPALFVVNRKGELVERIDNLNGLPAAIERHL